MLLISRVCINHEGLAPLPPSLNNDYYNLAVQTTDEAKERIQAAGVTANVDLIQGAAAEVLLDFAKENDSDIIIIGSRGLGGIGNLFWVVSVTMWCSMRVVSSTYRKIMDEVCTH